MKGKLAEALSYGLPCVTTSVGAEGYRFSDADQVAVTDDPQEFAEKIISLCKNEKLWKTSHLAALNYIETQMSLETVRNQIKEILS